MSRAALFLGLLLPAASLADPGPEVGLLTVDGSGSLASSLRRGLPRSRPLSRLMVIGTAELRARLSQSPLAREALSRAERAVRQAELGLVQMDRVTALESSRQAHAALEHLAGRFCGGELLVRARLVEQQAWLLHPEQPQRALEAARAALQLDPDLRPDLQLMSPRVAALLERARAGVHTPPPPTRSEAERLTWLSSVSQLIWIGVDGDTATLVVFDRRGDRLRTERLLAPTESAVVERLAAMLGVPPATTRAPGPRSPTTSRTPSPSPPRPWYRRWWVWTTAAAVLAGAGVTVGLLAGREQPAYSVTVRFR